MNAQVIRVELMNELIELVKNCSQYSKTEQTDPLIIKVLAEPYHTADEMLHVISEIKAENSKIVPYVHAAPCQSCDYICTLSIPDTQEESNQIHLKTSIYRGLKEIAANLYDPEGNQCQDASLIDFIHRGLTQISLDSSINSLYSTMCELNSYIDLSHYYKFCGYPVQPC